LKVQLKLANSHNHISSFEFFSKDKKQTDRRADPEVKITAENDAFLSFMYLSEAAVNLSTGQKKKKSIKRTH
jgi:hypothetical protein